MKEQINKIAKQNNLNFAWKVHEMQVAWIEKVDFKASLLLPVQIGLLTLLGAVLVSDKRPLLDCNSDRLIVLGILFLGLAIIFTTLAVIPRLGKSSKDTSDIIYFGHLKELSASTINDRISSLSESDQLSAVSRQVSVLARLNWSKHRLLRVGMGFTLVGALFCSLPLLFTWLVVK